jgi:hypothetical protein
MALVDYNPLASGQFAGESAVKQQAMMLLEEAAKLVAEAEAAASQCAEALCGPQSEGPCKNEGQKIPSGVFDHIEEIAARLRHSAGGIQSDMRRIQNRL